MFLIISHQGDDYPVAFLHTENPDDYIDNHPGEFIIVYGSSQPVEKIWKLDHWFYFHLDDRDPNG